MNIFNFFPKKEQVQNKVKMIITRFPLACIISVLITMLFFTLIAWDFINETSEKIGKVILSGIATFFFSVWVTIYIESIQNKKWSALISHIWSFIFWFLFYIFLSADISSTQTVTFFILTLFGVVSFLFSAPYIKFFYKWSFKETSYYIYFYKISSIIFMSFIVWWALTLGGNLAILAVNILFDIWYSISWDLYAYWMTLSLAFFTPLFALSEIPEKSKFEESRFQENIFFNFLIKYIASPFIYIYFFILYAYTIKVLINFSNWPKGEVSWLVIGFSLFWYAIYMFSYIFENTKNKIVTSPISIFRKYFPLVVLPQTWMLFYAIFLRVGQYDMTMNRYFVIMFGVWLTLTSLYLIVSKTKSLLYIPTLLTLFTLIISIWPWSVYNLPLSRQTTRLEKNLKQAEILKNDTIIPLAKASDIDQELSSQIYDGINYVCGFNNCENIQELFPKIYSDFVEKDKADFINWTGKYDFKMVERDGVVYSKPNKWEIVNHIAETIKVQKYYPWSLNNDTKYMYYRGELYPIDVTWYDSMDNFSTYGKSKYPDIKLEEIYTNLREIWDAESLNSNNNSFNIETDTYSAKIILRSANVALEESWKANQSLDWVILIKNK